ncbi:hypothetical protein LTR15_011885 [Elasticomyces elasticus]|nr:hypothetical protein LTR15_011885 [Elasticomyces elasticus]
MPNFGTTPEALLGRNDSRNAASTCRGLTSSGRACRRALAAPKSSTIGRRKPSGLGGVVAIVHEDGVEEEASFYCWQHKDQAEARAGAEQNGRRSTELFPLKERSSIDTMVQRLGLESVEEEEGWEQSRKKTRNPRPPRRTEAQDYAVPPVDGGRYAYSAPPAKPRPRPKKVGFWASLCCMATIDEDDYVEVVRHRKRTGQTQQPEMVSQPPPRVPGNKPTDSRRSSATNPARKPVIIDLPFRPAPQQRSSSNSHTNQLLSLIPPHLTPQTTSALLAELIKPISPHDEEGYIYIFWLTPQSRQAPAEDTARSLLSPGLRSQNERRISDVMTEYSYDGTKEDSKKTIMLKIGRANNVTRRMNEWQRQCGYALNLVRWYPYVSSTPQPSPIRTSQGPLYPDLTRPPSLSQKQRRQSEGVRKVPCVKRVERLIHLELLEKQVKRQCAACGKEHKEWFEVEASQAGIRGVDECVKRWVGWAEGQDS